MNKANNKHVDVKKEIKYHYKEKLKELKTQYNVEMEKNND
jgi:hypothetical protein